MVIQHNMASMRAFYQSKINAACNAKTSERLASGYRINRAADDAAGLSISQKMRRQIRGLNQANLNVQDGINFVQVGEGGMQEVHSILQRINELAVKAANDTNSLGDRTAIQFEIDALTTEIDRIAYNTSFNGHRMLCGRAPEITEKKSIGSSTGGGTGSVVDPTVSDALAYRATYGGSGNDNMGTAIYNPDGTIVFCGSTNSSDQDLAGAGSVSGAWVTKVGTDGEILWTTKKVAGGYGSITATADGGYLAAGGNSGKPLLTKLDANGNIEWTYQFQVSGSDNNVNNAFLMQDGSGHVFLSIQSFDYNGIKDGNGNPLGGTALGGRDTIMMVIDPTVDPNVDYNAFEIKAYRVGGSLNEQISKLYPTTDGGYIGGNYTTSYSIVQSNNDGSKSYPPTTVIGTGSHRAYIVKFDKDGNAERVLLFGDSAPGHNSGENVYQIIETSAGEYLVVGKAEISDTVGTAAPSTDETRGSNVWVMKLDKNLTPIWSRSYGSSQYDDARCVVETKNGFVIAGSAGAMDGDVTQESGYSGANAWVFMIDKDSGDMIWDKVHGGSGSDSFNFIFEDGNGDILLGGNSNSTNADLAGKNKGSSDAWFLKLDGKTGETAVTTGSGRSGGTGGRSRPKEDYFIYLQVGPDRGNRFQIDYADMRAKAVFGEKAVLSVLSHDAALNVISLCDRAIKYVSLQRSLYGGYQNALEHLYAANAATSENLTASESRIADADMAKEMVAFSRGQILAQVNMSVMAQANTANQMVLNLLTA